MDIPREPKKNKKRWLYIGAGIIAVVVITVALGRLGPAAPSVDKNTIYTDVVQRGEMVRRVRGPGTLISEQIRWIAALTAGRVERIFVQPGAEVDSSTVLLELSNPEVEIQALEAQRQMTNEEAQLVNLRTNLENQRLAQEALVAQVRAQYLEAQRTVKNNEELAEKGLISEIELQNSRDRAVELETRLEIERRRLEVMTDAQQSRLSAQRRQVERFRSIAEFRKNLVESMEVVAGVSGVLAELPLESGQWVRPGDNLARIVQPGRLKAELRIPETQARDVAVGQLALIDTRNDTIQGRVVRIDPAVQASSVTVDVRLEGPLPKEARPDLSVDGTIEIERLTDVLYVGRPAYGQANSLVGLFKVVENGDAAVRVTVRLGRSSVNTIEIVDGLQVGDEVILSDMSAWDSYDRVRLR
ncbi:MAG: HlyD family efflux transporter periplasmic adaptor subunit [Gemmatimonadetes bacterium]|uniref:HlyD family efflux transporter periplasmic adaptor subunit n=1 Tax=Candidatus Kutchimonas denitrificans TaxID=3056748 RepID=A0AAE5CCS0_9BACT|nr:HlyD family efflux transporter periplasmic adaptor subunit [Gemmatimonadota bacterium]NIR76050.1 HlyD family efflux transporter periplasmic adaptor subunit [Candidatus Kutchimonas denitrificans]NIS00429.1 HlyD family efflux transporter periplasmic adaptor subunit [Gemmatimonadota bacterium]NIT66087.1 HlyD family efflux transporter periplasmic adaptor subunit [Gemmatimonadota bacterium]NIU54165.1 HlyD family efflux transporter periplasmic adaptor subunit [Gemmatimonadota bacterium]